MTVSVANTTLSNTPPYTIDRINEMATAMRDKMVSAESNAAVGNVAVTGTFQSNVGLFSTGIAGGNASAIAALTIISNVSVSGGLLSVGSNVTANTSAALIGNSTVNAIITSNGITWSGKAQSPSLLSNTTSAGTSAQIIDSFLITEYRVADYLLTVKDTASNSHQSSKVMLLHDNGATYINEFAVLVSNNTTGSLINFTANANSTHARLVATPTVANTVIKYTRNGVAT